jgi:hypothetical protein
MLWEYWSLLVLSSRCSRLLLHEILQIFKVCPTWSVSIHFTHDPHKLSTSELYICVCISKATLCAFVSTYPPCVALDMDRVNILLVYPSQLQESVWRPPLPDAHTKIEPFPLRPWNSNTSLEKRTFHVIHYKSKLTHMRDQNRKVSACYSLFIQMDRYYNWELIRILIERIWVHLKKPCYRTELGRTQICHCCQHLI